MGKIVQVNPDYQGVSLPPDGRFYNAGASVTLTDAEYSALPVSTTRAISVLSSTTDPTRSTTGSPQSLGDAAAKVHTHAESDVSTLVADLALRVQLSGAWTASTAVIAYALYRLPTGGFGYVTAARTTRASFDATERAAWTFLPGGHYEVVSSGTSATWTPPTGIDSAVAKLFAAGGSGGSGGTALTSGGVTTQVGGGGGGAGTVETYRLTGLSTNTAPVCTIGAGGVSQNGVAANGVAGTTGIQGGDTTVLYNGITYTAKGGAGGSGGAANSTATTNGGAYGSSAQIGTAWMFGAGGTASSSSGLGTVGSEIVGGGAGGPASGTLGGLGGNARTAPGLVVTSQSGKTATTAGGAGTAATQPGCGGAGGGAGAPGGASGASGAGAGGQIEWTF